MFFITSEFTFVNHDNGIKLIFNSQIAISTQQNILHLDITIKNTLPLLFVGLDIAFLKFPHTGFPKPNF